MAIHLRTGLFAALFIAGIFPAQAALLGIPGFFNPVTRVFVPLQVPSPAATAAPATGTIKVEFTVAIKSVSAVRRQDLLRDIGWRLQHHHRCQLSG